MGMNTAIVAPSEAWRANVLISSAASCVRKIYGLEKQDSKLEHVPGP